jgi:hypothetical protein
VAALVVGITHGAALPMIIATSGPIVEKLSTFIMYLLRAKRIVRRIQMVSTLFCILQVRESTGGSR